MIKIARYIVLLLTAFVGFLGCSPYTLRSLYQAGYVQDDYRYGDLYRLSNLPQFKQKTEKCTAQLLQNPSKKTYLYIIGDSFTEPTRVDAACYAADSVIYVHWDSQGSTTLDFSAKNVLILQCVERNFRKHFKSIATNFEPEDGPRVSIFQPFYDFWKPFEAAHKNINERFESFLCSSDLVLWVKEQKASFNYQLLGRTNEQVAVSPNGKHLLFGVDTDVNDPQSSFNPLSDSELGGLVKTANENYDHFKSMGFEEVYLSVIPNKTSVVAPDMGVYNHLIERLERHQSLAIPTISVWSEFSTATQPFYYKSDTHWNCTGQQLWLAKVNRILD